MKSKSHIIVQPAVGIYRLRVDNGSQGGAIGRRIKACLCTYIHVYALATVPQGQRGKFALAPGLSRPRTTSSASDGSRGRRHRKNSRRCGSLDGCRSAEAKGLDTG